MPPATGDAEDIGFRFRVLFIVITPSGFPEIQRHAFKCGVDAGSSTDNLRTQVPNQL
jgi:hypothetical protein